MRKVLMLGFLFLAWTAVQGESRQAAPQTPPATPARPQPSAPARPAQPAAPARATLAITVTDPRGATLSGIHADVLGQTDRSGETDGGGQVRFVTMPPGTYRVRFSGDGVITFEREVAIRPGPPVDVHVTLNPAPVVKAPEPPPPPPPPPPAPAPHVGPAGQPITLVIPDVLEKEFVANQPRRESLLSCSGNTRATMIQLNDPQPNRVYDSADAVYYVIGGEGTVRMNNRDTEIVTNSFVSVPRGVGHSFTRRGRRPLILIAVLSGAPCEEAK